MSASQLADLQSQVNTMKANYDESLDTMWMLLAGLLVFFMHAGFSLLEAGSVRFKNAQNILAKNLLVVTLGFLCWYMLGWPIAYGAVDDPNKMSGGTEFFMDGFWEDKTKFRNWFFQGAFCATGCTIVSGAMAERTQLKGFGIFCIMMCSIIYPMVAYWGWSGNGFLVYTDADGNAVSSFGPAYMDFAGSGIVHLVGGIGALVGSIMVGPRKGYGEEDLTGHSIPFIVLGTFALWFGWYGFNPGSTLSMKTEEDAHRAGLVAVNTTLSPCVSGLLVFLLRAKVVQPLLLDVGGFCNGILAGLVGITAGCAFVKPWEAVIIGFISGLLYQGASMLLQKLKVDDVVDAFPVHGVCGMWGVLALGFFGNPDEGIGGNGLFYGGDQLRAQVMALIVIMAWTGGLSLLIFFPLKKLGMLRLGDDFQDNGADLMEHTPTKAYEAHKNGQNEAAVVPTVEKIIVPQSEEQTVI
jgi:Amt family ammonium transporter